MVPDLGVLLSVCIWFMLLRLIHPRRRLFLICVIDACTSLNQLLEMGTHVRVELWEPAGQHLKKRSFLLLHFLSSWAMALAAKAASDVILSVIV